ncbi:hypothetical protein GGTG_01531 [Gaeumannomyces tritici R3-111a-1]|uniref:Uncharacterized protein n=1 Tax=Gaeumannomyces tritici (strain R3-111a-1) TaxID=644352 RepID=J3NJV0_GAET3|nr:hypothetical protein GGTG_01531 [Gaeumannomyces tritici R3-111a-1]EJT81553.1 hypothetical protein GGTG_01531 [Gaeumannomyces tritici R3-111a-1]
MTTRQLRGWRSMTTVKIDTNVSLAHIAPAAAAVAMAVTAFGSTSLTQEYPFEVDATGPSVQTRQGTLGYSAGIKNIDALISLAVSANPGRRFIYVGRTVSYSYNEKGYEAVHRLHNLGAKSSGACSRSSAASRTHRALSATQCTVEFMPARFSFNVSLVDRNISVAKIERGLGRAGAVPDVDLERSLTTALMRQFQIISNHLTNLYELVLGNALLASVAACNSSNNAAETVSQERATLAGVENAPGRYNGRHARQLPRRSPGRRRGDVTNVEPALRIQERSKLTVVARAAAKT